MSKDKEIKKFNKILQEKLKYYVYGLVDPRDNTCFYIGKGHNDRIFEHEKEKKDNPKNQKIKDIEDSGHCIKYIFFAYGLENEEQAYAVEEALITYATSGQGIYNFSKNLTNIVNGHRKGCAKESKEGIMTLDEISTRFGDLKDIPLSHITSKNILIVHARIDNGTSSNTYANEHSLPSTILSDIKNFNSLKVMHRSLGKWRVNEEKSKKIEYIISLLGPDNIIIGAYKVKKAPITSKIEKNGRTYNEAIWSNLTEKKIEDNKYVTTIDEIDGIQLIDKENNRYCRLNLEDKKISEKGFRYYNLKK